MTDNTLSFWDQQFRFASILPDFQHWLEITEQQSADFNATQPTPEILSYGEHQRQIVELFSVANHLAPQTQLLPVFVHGGFWRAQSAATYRSVMTSLSTFGPKQANLEYRLIPEVRMADVVADIKKP